MKTLSSPTIRSLSATLAALALTATLTAAPPVTRADLGWSLLKLEQTLAARDLDGRTIRRVNRRFDTAVSYFFTNRYSEAVALINEITQNLLPPEEQSPTRDWLMSLRVEIEPRAHAAGNDDHPAAVIRSLYDAGPFPLEEPILELRLHNSAATSNSESPALRTTIDLGEHVESGPLNLRIELDRPLGDLPPGTYRIEAGEPGGPGVSYRRTFILPRPVDALREEWLDSISDIADAEAILHRAMRIVRARAALLKARPSPLRSAEFLADLHRLHHEVTAEVAALHQGRDPYIRRTGDLWRPVATRTMLWPMRVYAPAGLDAEEPLPLVIGLHGAGGDENMFHTAYGGGVIQQLAEAHRFIVASPVTYPLAGDMTLLGELIDEMKRCYPVDPDRVYLIGHSLGAGTVSAALSAMPERFAAASCIAGAGRFANEADRPYPPVLVIGAEHDFVVPPSRVQQHAQAGIERGLPIKYRLGENWGHVLVVGGMLEEIVEWLLDHERAVVSSEKNDDREG